MPPFPDVVGAAARLAESVSLDVSYWDIATNLLHSPAGKRASSVVYCRASHRVSSIRQLGVTSCDLNAVGEPDFVMCLFETDDADVFSRMRTALEPVGADALCKRVISISLFR